MNILLKIFLLFIVIKATITGAGDTNKYINFYVH